MAKKTITITYDTDELSHYLHDLARSEQVMDKDLALLENAHAHVCAIKNDLLSGSDVEGLTAFTKFLEDCSARVLEALESKSRHS